MRKDDLDAIWNTPSPHMGLFQPHLLPSLPEAARRYLQRAIAPGTPLAHTVRLRMHGEIKLRGWVPFQAEQVIHARRGMIWRATTRVKGLPVSGYDRIIDGEGDMRWRILGLLPVITASGPDVSRSAAGRLRAELVWLPSSFLQPDVSWSASDESYATAEFSVAGYTGSVTLAIDGAGRLLTVSLDRWGNPDGRGFRSIPFGAISEAERRFSGYSVPSRLRVGWYFGTDRFEEEGEFFRCTIDHAEYR